MKFNPATNTLTIENKDLLSMPVSPKIRRQYYTIREDAAKTVADKARLSPANRSLNVLLDTDAGDVIFDCPGLKLATLQGSPNKGQGAHFFESAVIGLVRNLAHLSADSGLQVSVGRLEIALDTRKSSSGQSITDFVAIVENIRANFMFVGPNVQVLIRGVVKIKDSRSGGPDSVDDTHPLKGIILSPQATFVCQKVVNVPLENPNLGNVFFQSLPTLDVPQIAIPQLFKPLDSAAEQQHSQNKHARH